MSSHVFSYPSLLINHLIYFTSLTEIIFYLSIPVAVRSKEYICCQSIALIVGSNPAEGMDVFLLFLCVV